MTNFLGPNGKLSSKHQLSNAVINILASSENDKRLGVKSKDRFNFGVFPCCATVFAGCA